MMDANRLWAKSKEDVDLETPSMFLPGHLSDVYQAAIRVVDATGNDQLQALGLDPATYFDRFRRIVLLAAAVHDLGKANNHFQGMIRKTRDVRVNPQGVRHEWVTVLMLKSLREWLLPAVSNSVTDFNIVEWAVAGHHPGYDHASPPRTCPHGSGTEIILHADYKDFQEALSFLQDTFHPPIKLSSVIPPKRNLVGTDNVYAELIGWAKTGRQLWEAMTRNEQRMLAAVKDCLIAADVAGSALPREISEETARWQWITDSFAAKPKAGELQSIVDTRSATFKDTDRDADREQFQACVAASSAPVTFVKAGCGSGKTLSAYMWATRNYPKHRLFFCYPTTGTATEGYRDYLYEPDVHSDLFHSRRDVDFEIILGTGWDGKDAEKDTAIRIDSLDAWATPIVACTVDTVLGVVQNNKRGLFAWPALAQSAFVFDEIHAYDDRLFGALLRFLRDVPGVPCLLMTASLPTPREEALKETLKQVRSIALACVPGPEEFEILPRYHLATVKDNDPLPMVEETLEAEGKVLWVCNTVNRVMDAADRAAKFAPTIYHSRFKYEDRVEQHKRVIDAFRKKDTRALAICSQVAEMSLDLSADLLVTDRATVPALIQRLGRLNRRAKKGSKTKAFIVIEPEGHLPYTPADLEAAKIWLEKLKNLPTENIRQRDLAEAWEQSADNPPELVPSAWLDGGPTTTVTELREASIGITVLMRADAEPFLRYEARVRREKTQARERKQKVHPTVFRPLADERLPKHLGRNVIPMPPPPTKLNWRSWPKFRGIPIVEDGMIVYDKKRGATWQK